MQEEFEIIKNSWEEQEWDTESSFACFRKYFLPQKAPRSLTRAYHDYLTDKGKTKEFIKDKKPPGIWQRWFRGQDVEGRPFPNSVTWKQRAETYDLSREELKKEIEQERKLTLVERELKDYDHELEVWQNMVNALETKMDFEKEMSTDPSGFDPRPYIRPFDDLVKIREKLATFGRRSVGLPSIISQDQIINGEQNGFKIVWDEPAYRENDIGIGAEIVENAIKKRIELKANAKNDEIEIDEWEGE